MSDLIRYVVVERCQCGACHAAPASSGEIQAWRVGLSQENDGRILAASKTETILISENASSVSLRGAEGLKRVEARLRHHDVLYETLKQRAAALEESFGVIRERLLVLDSSDRRADHQAEIVQSLAALQHELDLVKENWKASAAEEENETNAPTAVAERNAGKRAVRKANEEAKHKANEEAERTAEEEAERKAEEEAEHKFRLLAERKASEGGGRKAKESESGKALAAAKEWWHPKGFMDEADHGESRLRAERKAKEEDVERLARKAESSSALAVKAQGAISESVVQLDAQHEKESSCGDDLSQTESPRPAEKLREASIQLEVEAAMKRARDDLTQTEPPRPAEKLLEASIQLEIEAAMKRAREEEAERKKEEAEHKFWFAAERKAKVDAERKAKEAGSVQAERKAKEVADHIFG